MNNDPMADMLGSMAAEGWGAFQNLDQRLQQDLQLLNEQQANEAKIVADALNTEAGRKLLDWLLRRTLLRPPSAEEAAAATIEESALRAERRKGQNSIVFILLHALAVAAGNKQLQGAPE